MKKIILAGGCFWGLEAFIKKIDGIIETEVGYANGIIEQPTYEQVITSGTGHAEVVHITYDEKRLSLLCLLNNFFNIIDPTLINRQGPDIGHQYRTGIFYYDNNDKNLIETFIDNKRVHYDNLIVTEVEPVSSYYRAEEYHQDYLTKHPNGYCHIDLNTPIKKDTDCDERS